MGFVHALSCSLSIRAARKMLCSLVSEVSLSPCLLLFSVLSLSNSPFSWINPPFDCRLPVCTPVRGSALPQLWFSLRVVVVHSLGLCSGGYNQSPRSRGPKGVPGPLPSLTAAIKRPSFLFPSLLPAADSYRLETPAPLILCFWFAHPSLLPASALLVGGVYLSALGAPECLLIASI